MTFSYKQSDISLRMNPPGGIDGPVLGVGKHAEQRYLMCTASVHLGIHALPPARERAEAEECAYAPSSL